MIIFILQNNFSGVEENISPTKEIYENNLLVGGSKNWTHIRSTCIKTSYTVLETKHIQAFDIAIVCEITEAFLLNATFKMSKSPFYRSHTESHIKRLRRKVYKKLILYSPNS
ncbi:hypothetical protein NEAUS07_2355 [Nematocida ausubeli]|nr:hypothetical protein NEAUS07_2355 [Nematocida ausubeli]